MLKNLFKKYFVAGALVLFPIAGTIWIIRTLIFWIDEFFISFIPVAWHPKTLFGSDIPGLGFVLTLVLILLVGGLTRLYVGKLLIRWGDQLLRNIPFGSSIYSALKQFLHTVVSKDSKTFKQVVLVEFPNPATLTIGFVTNAKLPPTPKTAGRKLVSVFIPTTPNPTTGFLAMVDESRVTPLDIPVDQAFKLVISAGVVAEQREF